MRGIQGYWDQIQELRVDLVDKSIAETISVNESFCVCLSTTWTDCTINQKVLISKLTLFIHWCLCEQGRNSVIRFNSFSGVTECENYLFFGFNTSDWVESKEVCLSCICTEGLAVQALTLCPSPLQYRHRLFCIQWVFSATDSGSQRQDWAVKRFIGSSPVVETVTRWVTTKGDVEVLKNKLSGRAGWGVVMQRRGLLCITCWAARWWLSIVCKVRVNSPRFKPVMFTVMRSWWSSSEILVSSADFLAFSFQRV